jgi:hypothetical protein
MERHRPTVTRSSSSSSTRDYEAELAAHRASLEMNPFAECTAFPDFAPRLSTPASDIDRADEICVETPDIWLVVGYPFQGQYAVEVPAPSAAGFTHRALFEAVVAVHAAMYDGATVEKHPTLHDPIVVSAELGRAYHEPDGLFLERVAIAPARDGRRCAWISLGS